MPSIAGPDWPAVISDRSLSTGYDAFPRVLDSQKPRIYTKFVQNPWEDVANRGKTRKSVGRRREPWEDAAWEDVASRGKGRNSLISRRDP